MVVRTPDIVKAPKECDACGPVSINHEGEERVVTATFPAGEFTVGLLDIDGQVLAKVECPSGHQRVVSNSEVKDFPSLAELIEDLIYLNRSAEEARRRELQYLHLARQHSGINPHPRHLSSY